MASSGKQKTTWSKIQRESALRDKRADKAARKVARRLALEEPSPVAELSTESSGAEDRNDGEREGSDGDDDGAAPLGRSMPEPS